MRYNFAVKYLFRRLKLQIDVLCIVYSVEVHDDVVNILSSTIGTQSRTETFLDLQ